MAFTQDDLLAKLDALGISYTLYTHSAVFTVDEAQEQRGEMLGGHSKNLFLKDKKGNIFVVVTDEAASVDLKTIHTRIGAQGRVSFGKPELLWDLWGVEPGSVTPFGAINDTDQKVTVVLDRYLLRHDLLNFHPLKNTATITVRRADLIAFLEAVDHPPKVIAASAEADAMAED